MNTAIVVPSIHGITKEWIANIPLDTMIYIVDDTQEQELSIIARKNMRVLYRKDQEADNLKKGFMQQGTAGCRNYGIWKAWKDGADIIINLDDDVILPYNGVQKYETILGSKTGFAATEIHYNGTWANTINSNEWFARGFPYQDRINYNHEITTTLRGMTPKIHMGLWKKNLDLNGIDKIMCQQNEAIIPEETGFGQEGYYPFRAIIPLCAMNCGAQREAALGLMQIPMGFEFYSRYRMYRIEDIWGGYIWQRLFQHTVTFGAPYGIHQKSGNLNWEIWSEHYSNILAKDFEKVIGEASSAVALEHTQAEAYSLLANRLCKTEGTIKPYFREFINNLSETLEVWAEAFS